MLQLFISTQRLRQIAVVLDNLLSNPSICFNYSGFLLDGYISLHLNREWDLGAACCEYTLEITVLIIAIPANPIRCATAGTHASRILHIVGVSVILRVHVIILQTL